MEQDILLKYGFSSDSYSLSAFGTGLINHTWIVKEKTTSKRYILQCINHAIFKSPEAITSNISLIDNYLKKNYPGYLFEAQLRTIDGEDLVKEDGKYYRLYRFVEGSHSVDVVKDLKEAYEAAKQFGKFTANLANFDVKQLQITLPDFHNLPLRFEQFKTAIQKGNPTRIAQCKKDIQQLLDYAYISDTVKETEKMPVRVIHHDTKISNVLFNQENKGMCVIDLDTIMPGYFISDVGDMMRTYLSPISEEERDWTRHEIRIEIFEAIVSGYLSEMGKVLQPVEKAHFVYSGSFMIYMQALRFITDYLNNDVYYGAKYEDHNLVRGENQLALLKKYLDKEKQLQSISERYF